MRVPACPAWSHRCVVLRALLLVLPCAALALALPRGAARPGGRRGRAVRGGLGVVRPTTPSASSPLALVAGWWTVHDVVDWRLLVVGVLLAAAHVVATLASYGPATLAIDPRLARLWLRPRAGWRWCRCPSPGWRVRGLDPRLAPSWLWLARRR